MRIVSDPLPVGLLDQTTSPEPKFSVDLDDPAAVDTQIDFLLGYVNTLRKFTGRGELSKAGTGNVRKRGSRKTVPAPLASVPSHPTPQTEAVPGVGLPTQ